MATGIAAFGFAGFKGQFGWENNELHLSLYLLDAENQLFPLMQKLFGEDPGKSPQLFSFPGNWTSTTFVAWDVQFESEEHGCAGNTEAAGDFGLLDSFPTLRGGLKLDVAFRPVDTGTGDMVYIDDEAWDFAAQTMSLVGNNFGQNPNSLIWQSDLEPITNITAIVKIIPKIEFAQRRVFVSSTPAPVVRQMIGSVNEATLNAGASGDGMTEQWPPETVLLTGLPLVRRWRFDGQQIFQQGIKLAINTYWDNLIDEGGEGYVTWNRLYRPDMGGWDTVLVGPNQDGIYPTADLAQVFS